MHSGDERSADRARPQMTRRSALGLIGTAGLAVLGPAADAATKRVTTTTKKKSTITTAQRAVTAAPTTKSATTVVTPKPPAIAPGVCMLTPEQEQGPFYVELPRVRADITDRRAGIPMTLQIMVVDPTTCAPLANAAVDVWHADAAGAYSTTGGSTPYFLRGVQLTGADGVATFTSIFPGWYPRRTNHVHVKVRVGGAVDGEVYNGGHTSHTGNLFFDEQIASEVAAMAPYSRNTVARTPLTSDFVYRGQNGDKAVARTTKLNDGYVTQFVLGVDPNATPPLIGIR
jgi:protocatechuate 3,4-dioxygenase beta subunit